MRHWKIILCVLALGVTGWILVRALTPARPAFDSAFYQYAGEQLVAEALKAPPGNRQIILYAEADSPTSTALNTALINGVREACRRVPGTQLVFESPTSPEALRHIWSQECLPAEVLTEVQRKYPGAQAIISLFGVPCAGPIQPAPGLVALSFNPAHDWGAQFGNAALQAVICRKPEPATPPVERPAAAQLFAATYRVVTRENFTQFAR